MADQIFEDQYIGREAAWHGKGHVTGQLMTLDEIRKIGILFNVEKRQLEYNGKPVAAWGVFDGDRDRFICPSSETYSVQQHSEGFEFVEEMMGEVSSGKHWETAGVLRDGRVVWGLVNMAESFEVVPGDVHKTYLLFSTSHDGTLEFTFHETDTRVVCNNTLTSALKNNSSVFSLRHSKNAGARMEQMKTTMRLFRKEQANMQERFQFLAGKRVDRESLRLILEAAFPSVKKAAKGELKHATRVSNQIETVSKLFNLNDGEHGFDSVKGSAYNLLNAFTEYTDHFRSCKGGDEGRGESAMFGSGNTWKNTVFDTICRVADNMPAMNAPAKSVELVRERENWLDLVELKSNAETIESIVDLGENSILDLVELN